MIDLSTLPAPAMIELLDVEQILARKLAYAREKIPAWTAELESDPVMKLLEESAYTEMLLRAAINNAATSNLLAFAKGTDLDHLGAFYDCERMAEEPEPDERFRLRIQLRIAALGGNGTRESYRYRTLSVSQAVKDACVLQPVPGKVEVALWVDETANPNRDEVGSDEFVAQIIQQVLAKLTAEDERILGVPVSVRSAQVLPASIEATLFREPNAAPDLVARIAEAVPEAVAAYAQLGRDLPRSWIQSILHRDGISRVELKTPATDITVPLDAAIALENLTIIDGGTAW